MVQYRIYVLYRLRTVSFAILRRVVYKMSNPEKLIVIARKVLFTTKSHIPRCRRFRAAGRGYLFLSSQEGIRTSQKLNIFYSKVFQGTG